MYFIRSDIRGDGDFILHCPDVFVHLSANIMCFSELPNEILDEIISYVHNLSYSSDGCLLALSLTCKAVSRHAQARLHKQFFFLPNSKDGKPRTSLIEYTRTLYERPDLAAKVTDLSISLNYNYGWEIANEVSIYICLVMTISDVLC